MAHSKAERLAIFLQRLGRAAAAASADQAYELVVTILNEVEDELSGAPFDPSRWQTDGRMYPPEQDNRRVVKDHPEVSRYRSLAHNTFIGSNGAIEVQTVRGEVLLRKAGLDGRYVWQI